MPTYNDEEWRNVEVSTFSEFFRNSKKEECLLDTPPSDSLFDSNVRYRQILNLLFVIDVSGSMRGQRMGMVNYALENIFKELKSRDEVNTVIKVGVMEFAEEAAWVTPSPVLLDDFVFTRIEAQPRLTSFGPAFDLLEEKLSRKAFMDPRLGTYFAPVILFVTDGEPADVSEWPAALGRLKKNEWFRQSAKYAIAVGEEARTEGVLRLLGSFTDDINNVRYADEGEALCDLLEYVAVRASEIHTSAVEYRNRAKDGNATIANGVFDKPDPSLFSSMLE